MSLENCVLRENRLEPGLYYGAANTQSGFGGFHIYKVDDPGERPVKPLCSNGTAYRDLHSNARKGKMSGEPEDRRFCERCLQSLEL